MLKGLKITRIDSLIFLIIIFLTLLSTVILRSVEPSLYPGYFIYVVLSYAIFYIFFNIEYEVFNILSGYLYVFSIILLLLPLIIGKVTRGAIRWIPIGSLTIQPSEVARPFLLLYFAKLITETDFNVKKLFKLLFVFFVPVFLILIQPSLGVSILTTVGFLGVLLASSVNKKHILMGIGAILLIIPFFWLTLAPYQRERISIFINPNKDPYGAGYNGIQSMISVGSGKLFGRGLGEGVQTQLKFLPEKHTDFIFAAIAEELGFVGCALTLLSLFSIFLLLINITENSRNHSGRAYVVGVFFVLFAETFIHIGMNMGLLPITGVPLPLVSAGGSALLGTMMCLAIALNVKKE